MSIQSLQTQAYELADKMIERQANEILVEYRMARTQIYERLKSDYAKYLVGVEPDNYWTMLNQYNRLQKLNMDMQGIYTKLTRNVYNRVLDGQHLLFEEAYYRQRYVTEAFAGIIGEKVSRQALNPLVSELSITGDLDLWKQIRNERLKEIASGIVPKTGKTLKQILADNATDDLVRLQQTIKQGLITGMSYNKQERAVKDIFDGSAYKTQRVIRTEGNRNLNAASYVESRMSGVSKQKRWVATLDGRTRDEHGALDGATVGIDEYFTIGGDRALYPGGFANVSNNVNCRCTIVEIIKGLEPTIRRGIDPLTGKSTIITYKNYDEWRATYAGN